MHTQVIKDDAIKSPDFAINCKIDPSTDQPQFLQLTAKKRDHDRATAGSSSKRWGVVIGRHRLFQYASNLFPAKQIDGHRAAFVLTTMPVDADYEVVVDAALAFGGMDQHHANSYCDPKSVWVLYKL